MCLDWILSLFSHPLGPISCRESILFFSVNSKTRILCSIVCGKPRIFFVTLCSLASPCLTYLLSNPFYLVVIKCLSAAAMQSQGCVCVCVSLCSQVAVTFAVGSEVGLQSSSDFRQMGKPFLMGTVALGEKIRFV